MDQLTCLLINSYSFAAQVVFGFRDFLWAGKKMNETLRKEASKKVE